MSNYCPLYTSIWNDAKFTEYTSEQQLIFVYLISNPSCKLSGIYQISPKQIAYSTNIPINTVIDSLKGYNPDTIEYDTAAGIIFLKNHFKHNLNKIGNPKTMLQSLLKSSELTNHDDFWKMFTIKYNKEVNNLANRIKDFDTSKINQSFLGNYLIENRPSKHKGSFHTETSVDPHLISISISNKSINKDIKEVKEEKVKKVKGYSEDFETLWKTFSERAINTPLGSKKKAYDSYVKCIKNETPERILEGLKGYLTECESKGTYTAAATTFLNQERYSDYFKSEAAIKQDKIRDDNLQSKKEEVKEMFKIDRNDPKSSEIMSTLNFMGKDSQKLFYSCERKGRKIFVTDKKFNRDWINREHGEQIKKAIGNYSIMAKEEYQHYL